jgi:hypothetical protein
MASMVECWLGRIVELRTWGSRWRRIVVKHAMLKSPHKQAFHNREYRLTAGYKFAGNALGVTGDDAYTDGSGEVIRKGSYKRL